MDISDNSNYKEIGIDDYTKCWNFELPIVRLKNSNFGAKIT